MTLGWRQAVCGLGLLLSASVASARDAKMRLGQGAGKAPSGRLLVLAIGVDRYQDEVWKGLKWPARDAEAVAAAVGKDTERQKIVRLLTGAKATRAAVSAAMKDLRAEARGDDLVVVYFSGHGTLVPTDEGGLEKVVVLHDTAMTKLRQTGLTHHGLVDWLESVPARRKTMIFATCHGGVGKSALSAEAERLLGRRKGALADLDAVSEGTLVLGAAAQAEAAREDDKLGGDIYTHYFVQGLSKGDLDQNGVVTALEAHGYARERTYAYTKGRQRPTAEAKLIGEADVPLTGRPLRKGLPVLEAYDEGLSGFAVGLAEKGGGPATEEKRTRLPGALPLGSGASRVDVFGAASGKRVASYVVDAERGERVSLEDLTNGPPFALGLGTAAEVWTDERFARLTGDGNVVKPALLGSWQWRSLGLGLRVEPGLPEQHAVRPGLDATTQHTAFSLEGAWRWRMGFDWAFGAGAAVSRENLRVTFAADGQELVYAASATGWGIFATAARELGAGFAVEARLGRRAARFALAPEGDAVEEVGAVGGDRWSAGVEMLYRIGGVARRL